MKIPLSWLKDYVDLAIPPQQIAKILTMAGLEVDAVEKFQPSFSNIVVGKILSVEPHPNADKLSLAQVSDGVDTFQVVCGAPNCRVGLKTAFAKLGAELKSQTGGPFKIKKTKIRGIESFGMLCSGLELGISSENLGIIEFSPSLKEGSDLAELYADTVFEISLTPNLNYAGSVLGVARELSSQLGTKFHFPKLPALKEGEETIESAVSLEIKDLEKCPRYACRIVKNVLVQTSPDWLKQKLEASGIRPVNNVVDCTNYVLLLLGQPLHAFDYDKIAGKKIVVRTASQGEFLDTLDGKKRALDESMLVIADAEKPLAIAGVMGGLDSEVNEATTNVLLESAYFEPSSIRKTSKTLGLSTDASRKFERGADPNMAVFALDMAAALIEATSSGAILKGAIDLKTKEFPEQKIRCRLSRVNQILGTHISATEVETIFSRLGFESKYDGTDEFIVQIPTRRTDISLEIDLIEDIAKVYGYDNIARTPPYYQASLMPHSPLYSFEKEVKRKLISEGLQEFINCDLIGPNDFKKIMGSEEIPPHAIRIMNPVSQDQSILRTTLLPGLLEVVKHNFDRGSQDIAGFEVGRVHFKHHDKIEEQTVAGIILTGQASPSLFDPKPHAFDFRDMKGILENFMKSLGITNYAIRRSNIPFLHPGRQAAIFVNGHEAGSLGEVAPSIVRAIDIPTRIQFLEINLDQLYSQKNAHVKFQSLSPFPASERDWTLTLLEKAPVSQVIDSLLSVPSNLLETVYLSDMYRSESLGNDKKNATFHFIYRDKDKTISQEAVDQEHEKLINAALGLIQGCLPKG